MNYSRLLYAAVLLFAKFYFISAGGPYPTTRAKTPAPFAIELSRRKATDTAIYLEWDISVQVSSQTVSYAPEGNNDHNVQSLDAVTRKVTLEGLKADSPYHVCVQIEDTDGNERDAVCQVFRTSPRISKGSLVALIIMLLVFVALILAGVIFWFCAKKRHEKKMRSWQTEDGVAADAEPLHQGGSSIEEA